MTQILEQNRLREFVRLLQQLQSLNEHLFETLDARIAAMRRGDTDAITASVEKERTIVERLREREGFRAQWMDALGVELGLPPKAGRTMTVSQFAARIDEAQRHILLDAAGRLRDAVLRTRQAERVASTVAREVVNHLRWVFQAVKPRDERPGVYSADGASVPSGSAMLELVG